MGVLVLSLQPLVLVSKLSVLSKEALVQGGPLIGAALQKFKQKACKLKGFGPNKIPPESRGLGIEAPASGAKFFLSQDRGRDILTPPQSRELGIEAPTSGSDVFSISFMPDRCVPDINLRD